MDGTLLNRRFAVPEKNREALAELRRRGIGVVLATGRTELMTRKFVQELGLDLPVIANNGSLVVDVVTRKILYQQTFSRQTLRRLIGYTIANDKDYFIYTIDKVFFSPRSKRIEIMRFYNSVVPTGYQVDIILLPETIEEVFDLLPDGGDHCVFKILVSYHTPEDDTFFRKLADVEAIPSQVDAFDIMPTGSTKGNALEFLVNYLRIDPGHVFAFGDNHNDLSMLHFAAFALVPDNGVEEAKRIAHFITVSNEDAGVAQGIYEYVIPTIESIAAK